ncbi:DUF6338 family protein [bacterium]|nr:DUF6338 family protein [bacterium]
MPALNGVFLFFLVFILPGYLGLLAFDWAAWKAQDSGRSDFAKFGLSFIVSAVSFLATEPWARAYAVSVSLGVPEAEFGRLLFSTAFIERICLMGGATLLGGVLIGLAWRGTAAAWRKCFKKGIISRYDTLWDKQFDHREAPLVMVEYADGSIFQGEKRSSSDASQAQLLLANVKRYQRRQAEDGSITFDEVPWSSPEVLLTAKDALIHFLEPEEEKSDDV